MSEVNDFQFKVILQCEQEEFNPTRNNCEYLVEMNGVERPLKDILKENIEQQDTIKELEKNFDDLAEWASEIAKRNVVVDEEIGELRRDNAKLRRKCLDLLVIIRTELLPRISDDEVRRLKEIVDNG